MALEHVHVAPLPPDRFKQILDAQQAEELDRTIALAQQGFAGRVIWSVNSTARGGGVAEMLQSLIAYSRGAGVDARWVVIGGEAPFFTVTKRIHNMLHGSPGTAWASARKPTGSIATPRRRTHASSASW